MSTAALNRRPSTASSGSAASATATSTGTKHERQTSRRPALRLVEGVQNGKLFRGRSVAFALCALGGVFAIQLGLSMTLISGAYAEDELVGQKIELQREHTAAMEDVNAVSSPQHLAELATGLGMVPQVNPQVLDTEQQHIVAGTEAGGAAAAKPLNTALVPNSILTGERDEAERIKVEQSGASQPKAPKSDVSSEFELKTPTTR